MPSPFSSAVPPGTLDLEALDEFLNSDDAPSDCMDLSELDGFLAGIVAGPELIPPSEFLPVIWGGPQPAFADADEARTIVGTILGRYNEIAAGLDDDPASYQPVFWQDMLGHPVVEDWAVGFMRAVAMRGAAWKPVLLDDENSMLLLPIGIIAGIAEPSVGLTDAAVPDNVVDEMMQRAPRLLPACVVGLQRYWRGEDVARGRPN